jgi:phage-related protein
MPRVNIVIYRDDDGSAPLLDWLNTLSVRVQAKCWVKVERLREMGHELRRPEADYLRDDIYELRASFGHVNYRLLYFFHGRPAVVLSHGITKEGKVPPKEIDLAVVRMKKFKANPKRHTYLEQERDHEEEGDD